MLAEEWYCTPEDCACALVHSKLFEKSSHDGWRRSRYRSISYWTAKTSSSIAAVAGYIRRYARMRICRSVMMGSVRLFVTPAAKNPSNDLKLI